MQRSIDSSIDRFNQKNVASGCKKFTGRILYAAKVNFRHAAVFTAPQQDDVWFARSIDRSIGRSIDRSIDPSIDRSIGQSIWIHRWMDGWMDGWTDGWMDGWMDGSIDRSISLAKADAILQVLNFGCCCAHNDEFQDQ